MPKILANFFTKDSVILPLLRRTFPISPRELQALQPGLIANLRKSSAQFIEGLIDLDAEFLKATMSPYLFSQVKQQLQQLIKQRQEGHVEMIDKFATSLNVGAGQQAGEKEGKISFQNRRMSISPYVVLGGSVDSRINNNPLQNCIQISRNRYIQRNLNNLSNFAYISSLLREQTFGFLCQFDTFQELNRILCVTYEGNLQTNDYYVVDLNNNLFDRQGQIFTRDHPASK